MKRGVTPGFLQAGRFLMIPLLFFHCLTLRAGGDSTVPASAALPLELGDGRCHILFVPRKCLCESAVHQSP